MEVRKRINDHQLENLWEKIRKKDYYMLIPKSRKYYEEIRNKKYCMFCGREIIEVKKNI
jgi:hypothetical protein